MPDLDRDPLQDRQVGADDLDGVGALDPRHALFDVGLYVLREVEGDADELPGELRLQFFDQFFLGHARGPLVERLQKDEYLGIAEPAGVAAVVRPAMLGDHGGYFRMAQDNLANLCHRRHGGFERYSRGHRRMNIEIALLKGGKEFGAQPRDQKSDRCQKQESDRDDDFPVCKSPSAGPEYRPNEAPALRSFQFL